MRRWFGDDTLGNAAQHRALVRACCRQCTHDTYFDARGLLHIIRPEAKLEKLRFKCGKCGSRDVHCQRAYLQAGSGLTPVYVIRFVDRGQ